eukprot:TRINITY_DN10817_c0_g1_i2.p1 TRINITY_DN10817_c0_g1~~TRINITY_DN10817_c0_g1_i2.p1  ORF type:complete len:269 (-),score=13.45 TRINITY_DN10817_c0_g1_i2:106-912(-)
MDSNRNQQANGIDHMTVVFTDREPQNIFSDLPKSVFLSCILPYLSIHDLKRLCLVSTQTREWMESQGWQRFVEGICLELGRPSHSNACCKCNLQDLMTQWNSKYKSTAALRISDNGKTVCNPQGGWNTIVMGQLIKPNSSVRTWRFRCQLASSQGISFMIGVVDLGWLNQVMSTSRVTTYPGSGTHGVTADRTRSSIAYYCAASRSLEGTFIDLTIDLDNWTATFQHRTQETIPLPKTTTSTEALAAVASLCGGEFILNLLPPTSKLA